MSYPTFEEWWNVASGYFEEAAKNAWHARDAEIADLERQLAEAQSQVAVVDRALHDLGDTSAQAALDAYVQEKVDRALAQVTVGHGAPPAASPPSWSEPQSQEFTIRTKPDPLGRTMASGTAGSIIVCPVHQEPMVLYVYDRPGSPPGNGWVCKSCMKAAKVNS